jgi:hypothetical protein
MEAPRRYSVSPYYSFVTVPARPVPSFAESLRSVWRWMVAGQPTPTLKEQIRERQVVDLLAEEMVEEDGADKSAPTVSTNDESKRRMRRDAPGGKA